MHRCVRMGRCGVRCVVYTIRPYLHLLAHLSSAEDCERSQAPALSLRTNKRRESRTGSMSTLEVYL